MSYWINKVAVITDSESELGAHLIETLAESGMIVIGLCKSIHSLVNVKRKLKHNYERDEQVILYECDITKITKLKDIFDEINIKYDGISVLINNAFCYFDCSLNDGALKDVKAIIDVNINAVVACTRLVAGNVIETNNRGHIIFVTDFTNTESIKSTVFKASRSSVSCINDILREEFRYVNANIKVTNILCGNAEDHEKSTSRKPGSEVAEIIKYVLNTAEHLQVHEISVDLDS